MSNDSILKVKSMAFAKRIVKLYQFLTQEKQEYIMSKQVMRSGTSIGANIAEKECAETLYWLELLASCDYIPHTLYQSLNKDCRELLSMLAASIKSSS